MTQQSQYTVPDKNQGDVFESSEHNELKAVVNQKVDTVNTIQIEGNQTIKGTLTTDKFISTGGASLNKQFTISSAKDHIRLISTRTDGDTSKDTTTLLMSGADSNISFYVYSSGPNAGSKFLVDTDGNATVYGKLSVADDVYISSKSGNSVIINGGSANNNDVNIITKKDSKNISIIRTTKDYITSHEVIGQDNKLKKRIVLNGQRASSSYGVSLFDGELSTISLHTVANGIVIPNTVSGTIAQLNTGVVISGKTVKGDPGTTGASSSSVFFKSNVSGKGVAFEYFGRTINSFLKDTFYLNSFTSDSIPAKPILSVTTDSKDITFYGKIKASFANINGSVNSILPLLTPMGLGSDSRTEVMLESNGHLFLASGSAGALMIQQTAFTPSGNNPLKRLSIGSDGDVYIYANVTSWASRKSFIFSTTGDLTVPGTVFASNFEVSSDIRLKENIKPLTAVLDIPFIEYNFKDNKRKRYGVSAQDVQKAMPELITEGKDGFLKVSLLDLLILKVAELERIIKGK